MAAARAGGSSAATLRKTWLDVKAAMTAQSQSRFATSCSAAGPTVTISMRRRCASSVRKTAKVGTSRLYRSSTMRRVTALSSAVTIWKR
jgi:hypothetical protein